MTQAVISPPISVIARPQPFQHQLKPETSYLAGLELNQSIDSGIKSLAVTEDGWVYIISVKTSFWTDSHDVVCSELLFRIATVPTNVNPNNLRRQAEWIRLHLELIEGLAELGPLEWIGEFSGIDLTSD